MIASHFINNGFRQIYHYNRWSVTVIVLLHYAFETLLDTAVVYYHIKLKKDDNSYGLLILLIKYNILINTFNFD